MNQNIKELTPRNSFYDSPPNINNNLPSNYKRKESESEVSSKENKSFKFFTNKKIQEED